MWKEVSSGPASYGYYRGTPLYRGSGSGTGGVMAGAGKYAQGQGPATGNLPGDWTPTVIYLLILVIGEMIVFGWLSRHV